MKKYEVGFIYTRCFIQKRQQLRPGVEIIPLVPTGSKGEIHNIRDLLGQVGYSFTRSDLNNTTQNFNSTGQSILLRFESHEAENYQLAVESLEKEAASIAGALAVISANPVILLCAFTKGQEDRGVKFYFPNDRIIRHATNIHSFIDVMPAIEQHARQDEKVALLLKLYRASLQEADIDYQILFQLILLERGLRQLCGC